MLKKVVKLQIALTSVEIIAEKTFSNKDELNDFIKEGETIKKSSYSIS